MGGFLLPWGQGKVPQNGGHIFGFATAHPCFENCQLAFGFLVFLTLNFLIQAVVFFDFLVVAQEQVQDD